jgi:nitroreductase
MERPATTDFPIHQLIKQRWSPHAFDPRPVEEATLRSVFEAARWAMSSYNEQPWTYIYARRQDAEAFARILGCLVAPNQRWAKEAPVLAISAVKHNFEKAGKPNRVALHDLGAASAFLTIQAEALGLRVHQMAGIEIEKCRTELNIPQGWDAAAGIALGYPGSPDKLPEDLKARETAPRRRRPQREFVFKGKWGAPA